MILLLSSLLLRVSDLLVELFCLDKDCQLLVVGKN